MVADKNNVAYRSIQKKIGFDNLEGKYVNERHGTPV